MTILLLLLLILSTCTANSVDHVVDLVPELNKTTPSSLAIARLLDRRSGNLGVIVTGNRSDLVESSKTLLYLYYPSSHGNHSIVDWMTKTKNNDNERKVFYINSGYDQIAKLKRYNSNYKRAKDVLTLQASARSKIHPLISLGIFIVSMVTVIVLARFFYDIVVYVIIAFFFILTIASFVTVFGTLYNHFIGVDKSWKLERTIFKQNISLVISVSRIIFFLLGLALACTWVVYRRDQQIGSILQSVIGVIAIAYLLIDSVKFLSLKLITVIFVVMIIYDVFFVFVTPLFNSKHNGTFQIATSYMEAVATGSAGSSGETMPVAFTMMINTNNNGCYNLMKPLLGFGDAFIPGLLAAFVMLHDKLYQIRCFRNFIFSIIGYVLGLMIANIARIEMATAQPALLYICPIMWLVTVTASLAFGGRIEFGRMWRGELPPIPDRQLPDDNAETVVLQPGYVSLEKR